MPDRAGLPYSVHLGAGPRTPRRLAEAVRNALAALSVSEAPPPRMNALEALTRFLAVLRPCSGSMERSDGVLARSRSPCRDRLDER